MDKRSLSSYRLLSLAAIGACSVLVAFGPEAEAGQPLETLAAHAPLERSLEGFVDAPLPSPAPVRVLAPLPQPYTLPQPRDAAPY